MPDLAAVGVPATADAADASATSAVHSQKPVKEWSNKRRLTRAGQVDDVMAVAQQPGQAKVRQLGRGRGRGLKGVA
jgi:hypothetical protein